MTVHETGTRMPARLGILMVCTANVCRSPFAAHLLARLLGGGDGGGGQGGGERPPVVAGVEIDLFSRGVLARDGDEMDPAMVAIAREHGLDPRGHASAPLTADDVERADLIVCMERRHSALVTDIEPRAVKKLITLQVLGALSAQPLPDEVRELHDPRERLAWLLSTRGQVPMPQGEAADVADPYRRSRGEYDVAVDLIGTGLTRFAGVLTQR